jgi:hypothetical protein
MNQAFFLSDDVDPFFPLDSVTATMTPTPIKAIGMMLAVCERSKSVISNDVDVFKRALSLSQSFFPL